MGILGKIKLKKRVRSVVIGTDEDGEPVTMTVRAPRLQEVEGLQARIPEPVAPMAKDSVGRPVMERDSRGVVVTDAAGSPVPKRDKQDPEFLRKDAQRDQAIGIAMVVGCLGDQISPSVSKDEHEGNLVGYYLKVWDELEEAGLDVGAFRALSNAALELGAPMEKEEIESARAELGADEETQKAVKAKLGSKAPKVGKSA